MLLLSLSIWLSGLAQLAHALDPIAAQGGFLVNNKTKGQMTMNGMWYVLTNATTDEAAMDPFTNAETCTRDAALMQSLGINTIYVDSIDHTALHDDCYSIFNSVGIYVAAVVTGWNGLFAGEGRVEGAYNIDSLEAIFRRIDAIMDYENLLGIDLGTFFHPLGTDGRYADAQKILRAVVRDVKEYVHHNSPRPILVGVSVENWYDEGNITMEGMFNYMSCFIKDEKTPSTPDFVSIADLRTARNETVDWVEGTDSLSKRLHNVDVPIFLGSYSTMVEETGFASYRVLNATVDTAQLYNASNMLIAPYGLYSGGSRYEWANVRFWDNQVSNPSITRIDVDGNIQLLEEFDILNGILDSYNTEGWLSGRIYQEEATTINDPLECGPEIVPNVTSVLFETTTLTMATDWELPTRPPGLDAMITSGVGGTRGQMVDVLVTTIKHQIRDSNGDIRTDVVLRPSKSESRSTTARETSSGTAAPASNSPSGLSTGAKAGIGAGVGIGAALALAVGALFLLRRRKNKYKLAASTDANAVASDGSDGVKSVDGVAAYKAELATGPDVEAQPPAELPDKTLATPKEVPGETYPGLGANPVELPAHEEPVEAPLVPKLPSAGPR